MQPLEFVKHVRRSKADGIPFLQILINLLRALFEIPMRLIKPCVVMKVLNTHLETTLREPLAQLHGNGVPAFRNKIERRAESIFHFHFGKLPHALDASLTFYIVRQNQCKLLPFRPSGPACGRTSGRFIDRPDIRRSLPNPFSVKSANANLRTP